MKLLIILSVVAYGYADKLDRTYLPPPNAGTAGGSPGSLIAPGAPTSFGQGLPSSSGSLSGSSNFGASAFNQESNNGLVKSGPSFESSGFGQASGASSFGSASSFGQQSGFAGPSGTQSFAQVGSEGSQNKPGLVQQSSFVPSASDNSQGNGFGSIKGSGAPSFGPVSGPSGSSEFGSSQGGFSSGQANVYSAAQPERPQAAADRNAEILKYINENDGESYNYSYETSNGISAEESGVATNGVKAQGGFAYTGDDGTRYSLTYTADENGFQPQGEHLPTPHPIPEEILKSIEENAKAAAAGTQEGAYKPEEYESENSAQQYNAGVSSYNRQQGQNVDSFQAQGDNQPQSNQYPTSQDISGKGQIGSSSSAYGQTQPNQASNQFSTGTNGIKGQNSQYEQGFGSDSQAIAQGSSGQNFGQNVQGGQNNRYQYQTQSNQASNQFSTGTNGIKGQNGQFQQGFGSDSQGVGQSSGQNFGQNVQGGQNNGYQYNQPQNGFSSSAGQSPSEQNGPQINTQRPTSYSSSSAQVSGSNGQGIFGSTSNRPASGSSFQSNQFQAGLGNGFPQQGQQPLSGINKPSFGSNQPSFGSNQPSFGSNQEQQPLFGSSQSLFGAASTSTKGQQPTFGSNQPSFGSAGTSKPGQQLSFSSSQSSFGPGGIPKQEERPSFGSNQPSFGSAENPKQGQQTVFGSSQSSFGSKQPSYESSQSLGSQQTFGSAGSSNEGYQYGLKANQPAFNSGNGIRQGSQFGNKPLTSGAGSSQGLLFSPEPQGGSSDAARPQYQQNRKQPSFGSNTPSQGSQFGPNTQFRPNAAGTSPSRGSQPNQQSQFSQPGQQSGFGPSGPQSNGRPSSGPSSSEFGGPRQPPSFSPEEGYKY